MRDIISQVVTIHLSSDSSATHSWLIRSWRLR